MKDFAPEELAGFVRQALPSTQQEAIQQHLRSCGRCMQLVELYREIVITGSRERSYAPPDGIVRTVKAYFGTQKAAIAANSGFELLFDSLMQPATAGARASVVAARQLLYRIGSIYINMEVARENDSDRVSLIGQMLDSSKPGHPPAGVPVVLLNHGRRIARTASNGNGEFHLEFAVKEDLKLLVTIDPGDPVYLPIMIAQDRRGGGKQNGNGSSRNISSSLLEYWLSGHLRNKQ